MKQHDQYCKEGDPDLNLGQRKDKGDTDLIDNDEVKEKEYDEIKDKMYATKMWKKSMTIMILKLNFMGKTIFSVPIWGLPWGVGKLFLVVKNAEWAKTFQMELYRTRFMTILFYRKPFMRTMKHQELVHMICKWFRQAIR